MAINRLTIFECLIAVPTRRIAVFLVFAGAVLVSESCLAQSKTYQFLNLTEERVKLQWFGEKRGPGQNARSGESSLAVERARIPVPGRQHWIPPASLLDPNLHTTEIKSDRNSIRAELWVDGNKHSVRLFSAPKVIVIGTDRKVFNATWEEIEQASKTQRLEMLEHSSAATKSQQTQLQEQKNDLANQLTELKSQIKTLNDAKDQTARANQQPRETPEQIEARRRQAKETARKADAIEEQNRINRGRLDLEQLKFDHIDQQRREREYQEALKRNREMLRERSKRVQPLLAAHQSVFRARESAALQRRNALSDRLSALAANNPNITYSRPATLYSGIPSAGKPLGHSSYDNGLYGVGAYFEDETAVTQETKPKWKVMYRVDGPLTITLTCHGNSCRLVDSEAKVMELQVLNSDNREVVMQHASSGTFVRLTNREMFMTNNGNWKKVADFVRKIQ